ncbi:UNVERIFIED_CONTAM: hypothetical protein PYX00_002407 [Menopon gallinae]|uniref:Uncharacterized protein n=1 Tax=Menopon gallinae TaxID=328185 RepID=A0AAW2IGZ9_9NEOP
MVFVAGLIGIVFFFLSILIIGIWAGMKAKNNSEEEMMLAGRNIGYIIGTLTTVATWVGGGYINGASEVMFTHGVAWAQVPIGYSASLLVGALFFVKPMRDMKYVTLLDPFQRKYGNYVGGILFVPTILGDLFWVASILSALGSSLRVVTGLSPLGSISICSLFVALYTIMGAMYSVTYTDVFQIFFLVFGMLVTVPFVALNEHVDLEKLKETDWRGEIKLEDAGIWFDTILLLVLGGVPWQGYMQRILSIKTTRSARYLSAISMFGCAAMSIPSCFIGTAARVVDWEHVKSYGKNVTTEDASIILPLSVRHLTPTVVSFFGLGAIAAAVMSSADSSVLAFSVMVSRNIYKNLLRPKASDKEIIWILRLTIPVITLLSAIIALTVSSVYYLSVLSSDLIYVILFPQLVLVLFWKSGVNSYGCIASFFTGGILRLLSGEKALGMPAVLKYPYYDHEKKLQRFPHRTAAMCAALVSHVIFSEMTNILFRSKCTPNELDVLGFFKPNRQKEPKKPRSQSRSSRRSNDPEMVLAEMYPELLDEVRKPGTLRRHKPRPKNDPPPRKDRNPGGVVESLQCNTEEILDLKIKDHFTPTEKFQYGNELVTG